jgi:hypothetical protein
VGVADLVTLEGLEGAATSEGQVRGILQQIDLDIANLARDGKLAALKYAVPGAAGRSADRAINLKTLLEARRYYEGVLSRLPAMETSFASQK